MTVTPSTLKVGQTIIDRSLKILDGTHQDVPVLGDFLKVIQDAPADLRQVALDRGDINRYRDIFSQQTLVPMKHDRPVAFDISSIDASESDL